MQSFSGISGFSLLSNTSASYTGFYFLQLDPWHERLTPELSAERADAHTEPEASEGNSGGYRFRVRSAGHSGTSVLRAVLRSCCRIEQLEVLQQLWEDLERLLMAARKRPETGLSGHSTFRPSVPQLYVEVDQDRVLKQGLQFE